MEEDNNQKVINFKKRRSYTVSFKINVLKSLESEFGGNKTACSKKYGVTRSRIQDWQKQMDTMLELKESRQITVKKMRTIQTDQEKIKKRGKWPELDEAVYKWILEERKEGHLVDSFSIKIKAGQIFKDLFGDSDVQFKESNGWFAKFCSRFNVGKRAVTSIGQSIPDNALSLIEKTFSIFYNRITNTMTLGDIGNMDETPVYFDMPSSSTYDLRGVKFVPAKTTGNHKLRFTVVLSMTADGRKLPPMIIFKNLKKVPKDKFPKKILVTVSPGGSMTTDLMKVFLQKVWRTRGRTVLRIPSVLILDSHRSHMTETVAKGFKEEAKTELHFLPGGLTSILQPLDVYINKSFKSKLKKKWEDWLREGLMEFTKSNRRKRASYGEVAKWIDESWDAVDVDLIKRSFSGCGFGLVRDASQFHSRLVDLVDGKDLEDNECDTGITDEEDEFLPE